MTIEKEAQEGEWAYFWVDAICINQANNQEKNGQVSRMSDTYRSACTVIAWVGPDYEVDENGNPKTQQNRLQKILLIPEEHVKREVFKRPYFYRIWIVQGLEVARKVYYLSGRRRIRVFEAPGNLCLEYNFDRQRALDETIVEGLDIHLG